MTPACVTCWGKKDSIPDDKCRSAGYPESPAKLAQNPQTDSLKAHVQTHRRILAEVQLRYSWNLRGGALTFTPLNRTGSRSVSWQAVTHLSEPHLCCTESWRPEGASCQIPLKKKPKPGFHLCEAAHIWIPHPPPGRRPDVLSSFSLLPSPSCPSASSESLASAHMPHNITVPPKIMSNVHLPRGHSLAAFT